MYLEEYLNTNFYGKTVAVVGNAVCRTPNGKEIDNHEIVVRINGFVLSQPSMIGEKLTHWLSNCGKGLKNRYGLPISLCPFNREHVPNQTIIIYPKKNWRYDAGIERLTTGGTFLYILNRLGICADVYGFDFLQSGHYYKTEHKHAVAHLIGIDKEKDLITSLNHIRLVY